ncbi:hypothetical protein D9M72_434950 [compost metagenome]
MLLRCGGRSGRLDFLQNAGDHHQERGPQDAQGGNDVPGVGQVRDAHAVRQADQLQSAGQHMGHWQEDDGVAAFTDHFGVGGRHVQHLTHEIAVGDEGTFRRGGGAGGVHDGGHRVEVRQQAPLLDGGI